MQYKDRQTAGLKLASMLKQFKNNEEAIILALPRGGVPIGAAIAQELNLPLDIFLVRKLGVIGYEELAFGAIAEDGSLYLNQDLVSQFNINQDIIDKVSKKEMALINKRKQLYNLDIKVSLKALYKNKIIILVDDGIATGATMLAAIQVLKTYNIKKLIIAAPVAAEDTYEEIKSQVDEIYVPLIPYNFSAVGMWYENFEQVSDSDVIRLIKKNKIRN